MRRKFKTLKPLINGPAIYQISCTKTDKVYIGESVNVSARICKHFSFLRKGEHHNDILQNIFNKYGEDTFTVDILKYYNFDNITVEEKIKILKSDERIFQESSKYTCISMDKNTVAWNNAASDSKKISNKEYLDSIRQVAIEKCCVPLLIYNINTKETIKVDSIKSAQEYIEEKHLYRNIKDKVYLPYKNTYVAFYPDEFDPDLVLITKCKDRASVREVYTLYDLKNNSNIKFPSKTQFSLYFSSSRNDKLYDKYKSFIDENFLTAKEINSIEDFWNSDFVVYRTARSCCTCNMKLYLDLLKSNTTNAEIAQKLNVNRHTIPKIFKFKSKEERILEIEITAGHLSNLFKNWEASS